MLKNSLRCRSAWSAALCAFAMITFQSAAQAADPYPSKPIRLVLPQPPGGAVDLVGRLLAQRMSESLGRTVVVDNRPGANGIIAAETVAKAAPDGYTLFLSVDTNLVVNPALYPQLPYDPYRDFAPISAVARVGLTLVTNPALPVKSVAELIALAKSRPGELNYASLGSGTQQHLGMELFKSMAGVDITHIPFKGTADAMGAVMNGSVSMMFTGLPSAIAQSAGGKVKVLAVTSLERSALLPEMPTVSEAGVKDFELSAWFGLLAPTGTPAAIVERLSREVASAIANPDLRKRLMGARHGTDGDRPRIDAGADEIRYPKVGRDIRDSGAKVD